MKKVIMLAGPFYEIPPTKGAAVETWINEVSKRIITYQTHIISISHPFLPIKEFKDGVYYHRVHIGKIYKRIFQKILGWDIRSYNKRVFSIIKEIDPDIIHIHNDTNSREIIKWIKTYNCKIKIIFHLHNENNSLEKQDFPKINTFIGCSNFLLNLYKSKIEADKKLTLYNGVDIEKYLQKTDIKKALNNFFKDDKNTINICYFGRISPEKGVNKFLKLAILFKKNLNYKFHCFGEIPKRGDRKKFYESLKKIIKKENISNLKFYDFIAPQKIHLAYNYADIIIVPSKKEAFGMVPLEALASKKIVISSNRGGMVEFLDNKNSFIIEDYENFATEAKAIIENLNIDKIEMIKKHAIKTAKKFDWFKISLQTEKVYNDT